MTESSNWRKGLENWPHKMPYFQVDPQRSALVIVDMQNSTANLEHGWNKLMQEQFPELAAYVIPRLRDIVIPNNQRLVQFFRQHKLPIVYLTVSRNRADGYDWPLPLRRRYQHFESSVNSRVGAERNSYDSQVIDAIKPEPGDLVVNKTSTGPFNSTGLDQSLRNMGIASLVITGIATNACVETTMRDAADRGYDCLLVEDACSTLHPAYHEATLLNCEMIFGNVRTTDQIIAEFSECLGVKG